MPYRPFSEQNCSIANALAVVGERWSLLVMREILFGRSRFSEIKRNLGVAPNILSDRLQQLVEHGLLERRPTGDGGESHEGDCVLSSLPLPALARLTIDLPAALDDRGGWSRLPVRQPRLPRTVRRDACAPGEPAREPRGPVGA